MNIILLSGGSGKRLWPLSNDIRPKQYLKVLRAPDGRRESMVQRVLRQIREAGISDPVTIAAGIAQQGCIKAQLGDSVDVVYEPERRDTFPAIALSAGYLALEKKVPLDEAVVVLPVDPYAETTYFQTLISMERAVKEDAAKLVLMGIEPTFPSEKYGYIVPEAGQTGAARRVSRFTEKPTQEQAIQLIQQGALWNGGVFAFRLGYLMDIVSQHMRASSFDQMLARYGELKKISFDYEVVEKAASVAVVTYEGTWKDLGTWNTLTEHMEKPAMGLVEMGEGAEGTHVVNELDLPVVVLGVKNAVVVVTQDGILVSGKEESARMKPYVDRITQ